MNNASLVLLENTKLKKLEDYKLDEKSISEFKSKIKQVDDETKNNLGKELFELISSKKKSSEIDEEFTNKVIELIINGANLEYKDEKKGDFSLLLCARKGFLEIAYLLLRSGANANQSNNYLTTSIMAAARHGHKELLELLILLGANVNAKCLDGDNALMSAKRHNQQECFDILVHAQSSLTHRNIANQTILDLSGNVSFNPNYITSSNVTEVIPPTSEEDVFSLVEEAEQKLLRLKNK
jgi:hypothetical protein